MKRALIILFVVVALGAGWYFFLRPTNQITNGGVTYVVDMEGTTPTTRNGAQALSYTRGETVIILATPDASVSSPTCPSVAPVKERGITIGSTTVPLCLTTNGGIAMSPFAHEGTWHLVSMFSTHYADVELAEEIFSKIKVKD